MGSQPPYDPPTYVQTPDAPPSTKPAKSTGRTIGILLTLGAVVVVGGATLLYVTGVLGADAPDAPVRAYVQAYAAQDCDRLWSQFTDRGRRQLIELSVPSRGVDLEQPGDELKKTYCDTAFADKQQVELTTTVVEEQPDRVNATVEATLQVSGQSESMATTRMFQVAKVAGIWKIDSFGRGGGFMRR
jgi:hypothetical protein